MSEVKSELAIGLIGCGVVGSQVVRLIQEDSGDFAARSGAKLRIKKIAVRDVNAKREGIDRNILTDDANSVVNDPEIDIIIEVMGGIEPARTLILTAMNNGKAVVTANKALLAKHGAELFHASDLADVDFYYDVESSLELKPGGIYRYKRIGMSLLASFLKENILPLESCCYSVASAGRPIK